MNIGTDVATMASQVGTRLRGARMSVMSLSVTVVTWWFGFGPFAGPGERRRVRTGIRADD
jgi:hypothetical protein